MKKAWILVLLLGSGLGLSVAALASSHREAPAISNDPVADNTDVYFFRDPVDPSRLVMISNWIPLEEPAGGPNFFHFEPNIRYEFNVDWDGDALEDVVYRVEVTLASGVFVVSMMSTSCIRIGALRKSAGSPESR